MKDAMWFGEYHVTQTKTRIEYESLFNLCSRIDKYIGKTGNG